MLIVSDSSCITNLIRIGQINILAVLFKEVVLPEKVYEELSVYENQKEVIDSLDWLIIRTISNQASLKELLDVLDPGEAEAIVLAQELKADFLTID